MRLADWQGAFVAALQPNGDDRTLLRLVGSAEKNRLSVYRNNAFQALLSCLQNSFPVCQIVLGQDCFKQLTQQFSVSYPLNDANLNHYGRQFPQFLSDEILQHQAFEGLEYLAELAALEWALNQGYYAQDRSDYLCQPQVHPLQQLAHLSELQQQHLVLLLQPDIELLSCHYPVHEVWRKHQVVAEQVPRQFHDGAAYHLLIFRAQFKVSYCQISAAAAQLVIALKQGLSLGQLTSANLDLSELSELIERGWVAGYKQMDSVNG